jgi:hypothetical protein
MFIYAIVVCSAVTTDALHGNPLPHPVDVCMRVPGYFRTLSECESAIRHWPRLPLPKGVRSAPMHCYGRHVDEWRPAD